MKRQWYKLLLGVRDDPKNGEQSTVGAGTEPESALVPPDCDSETALVADVRPADVSMLEEYRGHVNTRSTGEFTILKVAQMLQNKHIRALPEQAKRAAILVALQAAGVKLADVIDDAVQRNEALDNAERAREKVLREFEMRKEEANRKVQALVQSLVAEYDARIQRNKDEISAQRDKFAEWRQAKLEEEQKIAEALSYLMDGNAPSG
jgi:DNA-binding transcriptional MerR regulator